MGKPEVAAAKPHYFEANEQDVISCGDCGASLEMTDIACAVKGIQRLRPRPDFVRLALGEIEPENYGRRLADKVDQELNQF